MKYENILQMNVNELINYALENIQLKRIKADEIEHILNKLSKNDSIALDNYIMSITVQHGDISGKMYIQGFLDCIKALKS